MDAAQMSSFNLKPYDKVHYAICSKCELEHIYKRIGEEMGIIGYENIYCSNCDSLIAKPRVGYFVSELITTQQLVHI